MKSSPFNWVSVYNRLALWIPHLSERAPFNMLALTHISRHFLYRSPAEMRLGIYMFSCMFRNQLGFVPESDDIFVFPGKRLNQIRPLKWDKDGFRMYIE
jgi:transposase